jgi:uncharacterized protein YegL
MGKYEDMEEVSSRTMTLFFVADTSGSMAGSKIGTLNEAIKNLIPEIQQISDNNADAKINIAILTFSTYSKWLTSNPVEADKFKYKYLDASGVTDLGSACNSLNEKLSRKTGFMNAAGGAFAPTIFLLSDGFPTDDYRSGIAKLKNNNWFKNAIKIAVAIGDDADEDVLAEFTCFRKDESVFKVHSPEALSKLIRFIAVTSSQIGSKSQDAGSKAATKQSAVFEQVQDYVATQLNDSTEDIWV